MYDCMRSGKEVMGAIYFLLLVLMGNIVMINLFLAILLGNFEKARDYRQKRFILGIFKEL